MSSGRRLMERIESGLGQGVGFAFAAILTAPLPVVMMAAGALAYSDARVQADRERVDLLLLNMEPVPREGDWGVTASGLLQVQRALEEGWEAAGAGNRTVPVLPDAVAAWWTRFLEGAAALRGGDQTPEYPPCPTERVERRGAGTWTDCVRAEVPGSGGEANRVTFFLVPPVAFEPFTNPGVALPAAHGERALFGVFTESLAELVNAGEDPEARQIVQAYFTGASGTDALWSRERLWAERAASAQPYDFRAAGYFYRTRAAWRRGRLADVVDLESNPLRYSPPSMYPPAVTVRSRRYVDYVGAGVVWTACLAVVSTARARADERVTPNLVDSRDPSPREGAPRFGDFLGALCADVADAERAVFRLGGKGGAEGTKGPAAGSTAPVGSRSSSEPERQARPLSSWWRTGVLVYRPGPESASVFRFEDLDEEDNEARKASLIAVAKPAVAERQDAIIRVPAAAGHHAEGFLLPAGIHGEEYTYIYLEFPSEIPPGVPELLGGILLLFVPGAVWFVGARRRAAVAQRALDAMTVDQLQVGVVRTDARGRVVFANDRAEELVGVPLTRLEGGTEPSFDSLFDPVVILADDFGAAWTTGQRAGRVTTMAEVGQQRVEGRSSRYFARLSEAVLSRVDAPRFDKHPFWCPWIEVSGSPRLDGAGPRRRPGEQVETYAVLRPVSPERGWDVLESLWKPKPRVEGVTHE